MIKRLKNNLLARNTFSTFIGMGSRIGIQAVYFIIIARSLGNEGYGAFIGTVSLVALLAPFASLGSGNLLVKNVSRNPDLFSVYWGNALILTIVSGSCLVALVAGLSFWLLPESVSLGLVILVAVSDILFARIHDICGQAYQAFQRLGRTAGFQVLFSGSRMLSAAFLLLAVDQPKPADWGWFYLGSTAVACLIAVWLVCRELGRPAPEPRRIPEEIREGMYFSISLSSQNIYNDLDKTLLARLASLETAGIYAAGYRIIDVAFTPVRSMLYAAYARFFQHGASGIQGSLRFAKKLLPLAGGYGLVVGVLLWITAPVVPMMLGEEYASSVEVIRCLSVIPLLRAVHYFAADSLTGSGHQGVRSAVQVAVTVVSVLVNVWLIPRYGWKGAAIALIGTDLLLAAGLWGAVALIRSGKKKQKLTQVA
ncbi:lipopolysaccharide biosynthesis protein [Staphylospora marina]|uniref:lipopolysaccharide biosynthesis protein n=1 Tax=Staphylospora marina TaxID=2490858 RepID=UPI000F5BED81|nr:oligosaccharide flippase family protein [Staphylospora marina]